ncbi:MAG TPA: hypothetical protein VF720_16860 [Candidatus Eisenbacteria bacterium]
MTALAALLLPAFAAPAPAAPRIVSQTKVSGVPGTIVAWYDSMAYVLGRDSTNAPALIQYWPESGRQISLVLGSRRLGTFLSVAPDGHTILVRETDSTGVNRLLTTTLPTKPPATGSYSALWIDHLPVSDADPHVTWYGDSKSFLYQDVLDDAKSTPSVFRFRLGDKLPRLYLFGCSRPLLAPSGDAVVCVGVDTLNPGQPRDLESRQPVGMEDIKAGDFHWVAPLRTWIPSRAGWSPDGNRIALVGYEIAADATLLRKLYIHSRITRGNTQLDLKGDNHRPDRDHSQDVACWSPDGSWIAVVMTSPRSGEPEYKGGVWITTKSGQEPTQLVPTEGVWRGNLFWVGPKTFLIGDIEPPPGMERTYWRVEVAG